MAGNETSATTGIDQQDPLPETNWFWRRVFTFAFALISVAFIWYGLEALWALKDGDHIYSLTRYMIGVHVILILFYMVAPSAEQIVKLIQSARIIRESATITRTVAGGITHVSTSAMAHEPPKPPVEVDAAPRSHS